MRAASAFREGFRRVNRAPLVLLGMYAFTLGIGLPCALALRTLLQAHLGASLAADAAASGVNYDWAQEFAAQATGLGATFLPTIIGFGAVLENLSNLVDNVSLVTPIAGIIAIWMVGWSFLSGGVLDRFARGRATRSYGFFAACGTHFWRFLRIGIIAGLFYYVLFGWIHPWVFDRVDRWTRDTTVERTAFAARLIGYAIFGFLLLAVNVIVDYARVRTVVEDRRSALGSVAASTRFVRRHLGPVAGLYLLNAIAFLMVVLAYALVARAPRSGLAMVLVLGVGQLYILSRHYLKLVFYASETALFQGELAHAAYTAAPAVVWPDSPAAEAVRADPQTE
jgi:hypothetical protein